MSPRESLNTLLHNVGQLRQSLGHNGTRLAGCRAGDERGGGIPSGRLHQRAAVTAADGAELALQPGMRAAVNGTLAAPFMQREDCCQTCSDVDAWVVYALMAVPGLAPLAGTFAMCRGWCMGRAFTPYVCIIVQLSTQHRQA